MKALGSSYLKFFVSRQTERERVSLDFGQCRHDFRLLLHRKFVAGDGLVSFRANCVASISTAASAQTNIESEEIQTLKSDQPKTVRVRFKLHKQCAFGQQFLLVGDDPSLGLWDPSDAVPLNWSEGHLWTAEVDIPSSEVIKYKFILKEIDGTVSWQPGPDRVLETWDTANIISVTEDWEISDFRVIEEEEVADHPNEPCFNGNLSQRVGDGDDDVTEEQADDNERRDDQSDEPSTLMVAENITVEDMSLMVPADNDRSNLSSLKNEGVPALIPGLATMPPEETEAEEEEAEVEVEVEVEASSSVGSTTTAVSDEIVEVATSVFDEIEVSTDQNQENKSIVEDSTTESDETEAATNPEISASASPHCAETSEVMAEKEEEKPRFNGIKEKESSILGSDMQWGRQALHKLLANLGFMRHS